MEGGGKCSYESKYVFAPCLYVSEIGKEGGSGGEGVKHPHPPTARLPSQLRGGKPRWGGRYLGFICPTKLVAFIDKSLKVRRGRCQPS